MPGFSLNYLTIFWYTGTNAPDGSVSCHLSEASTIIFPVYISLLICETIFWVFPMGGVRHNSHPPGDSRDYRHKGPVASCVYSCDRLQNYNQGHLPRSTPVASIFVVTLYRDGS